MGDELNGVQESTKPVAVLYFEDNETDAMLVRVCLESVPAMPVEITVFDRLSPGLAMLKERNFDLALLDLSLPDSQGANSLVSLRKAAPALPVVVISGAMDDDLAMELLGLGAQDCLKKGPALAARIGSSVRVAMWRQQSGAELALRTRQAETSRAHARAILEASLDAIVVFDAQGLVRYANPAAEVMFSRKSSELLSQPLAVPLTTDRPAEIDIHRPNGETGIAELHVVDIDWDDKRAHLATLRDITGRKQMEGALRRSEKLQALGTLAGGIAHDFNNILLAVSGNAKLALSELPENHPAHALVLEIAKAGSRATALTKKILNFSRQQPVNRQAMLVQPLVEEALSLLRATLPARVEIRTNFPAELPSIAADASQLHQIIVNLITNAVDAIGECPGLLEVTASAVRLNDEAGGPSANLAPGEYVRISVKDTGPGMDQKTLGRIFEPFFTTKPQGRGTGLGLAIVYGIMKDHLGDVCASSEVGKGTEFNLYFPVSSVVPVPEPDAPKAAQLGSGQRILYVDDEEPLVTLISLTLERLGYTVVGFTDPREALEAVMKDPHSFDAVVTDLSMPAMSGIEFAEQVLQVRPDLPVVVTTGYIRPSDLEAARRIGVTELILKPDAIEELGTTLHRLVGSKRDSARADAAHSR